MWPSAKINAGYASYHAAQNFAILRRIVMNLLRQDRTAKGGLKIRRMLACANDKYLAQLLGWRDLSV